MARTDNFTNFATDVADSIRIMTGKTDKIPASQFDTEIKSIKSGGTTIEKTIYDDGEYNALDDNADGYSEVDVQVLTVKNKQYIIKNGIEDTSVTGGHRFYRTDTSVSGAYTEIQGDGYLDLTCRQWSGIGWEPNNTFNTKKYNTLYIEWAFPNAPTDTSDQANARANITFANTTQEFRLFQGRSVIERHTDVFKLPTVHTAEKITISLANFTSLSSYQNYPLRIYNMWLQEDVSTLESVEKTITTNGVYNFEPSDNYKGFDNITLNIFTSDTFEPLKNYEMLYHNGNSYDDITGGYRKGYTRNNESYHNLTMNTDHILMEANTSDGYLATILNLTTQNEINFSGYSKMFVKWTINKPATTNFGERLGIASVYNSNIGAMGTDVFTQQKFPNEHGTNYTGFFGIPFENVDKGYPIIEIQTNVSGTHNVKIYDWFIVKQDAWKPLCDFIGLSSTDYENEAALVNDATTLELILNNTKARQYLINQCTGSMMMEVITNSVALNMLQQHEYFYEFVMNEHWLFFLQMAGVNTDIDMPDIEDPNDLTDELNTYNTEVTEQGVSINTIINLLDGKAIGSGSTDDSIQNNIFVQEEEPENKTGLWIKSSSLYNNVDFIDSGKNFSWERSTNITAVRETTAALVGDTIYYFGGLVSGGNATNYVNTIDTKTDSFTSGVATMPYSAYGITAVAHGTDIYLFGGRNASAYYNYARKFDTLTKNFTTLTALPYNAGQIASAIIGTDIYLFGGAISSGQTTNVYKYDILSNSYTQLTSLPSKRNCTTVCAYGTDIYVFGGHDGTSLSDAYKYDTLTNTYTKIADLPQGLWGAGVQLINNKFYIFGGINNATSTVSNITYIYNPVTNEYSTTAKMYFSAARIQSASVFVNGNIYVCGGQGTFSTDASTQLTPEFIPYVQKGIFTNSLDSYTNTANTIVIDCSIDGINVELYKMSNKSIHCNIDNVLCYSAGVGFDETIPIYYGNGEEWLSLETSLPYQQENVTEG